MQGLPTKLQSRISHSGGTDPEKEPPHHGTLALPHVIQNSGFSNSARVRLTREPGHPSEFIAVEGRPMSIRRLLVFVTAFFLITVSLPAQDSSTGSIRGTVLDASGSRVAQASIVVVNSASGARYTATSDAEGEFAIDLLPPGDYAARVEAQGMSPQLTPQLHVDVGGAAAFEFRLGVAGAQESLTVSAAPALVETMPSAVSTLLDERALSDFPLNGRRFSDLTLFSSAATQDPRSLTSATNGDLSFGGTRGFQNSFLVDGGDFNNAFFAQARGRYRAPYELSTDVVQEFRVSSNSYGAEQGRSGGAVVNVVTKSGSNHYHGTAFYHLRDRSFGAADGFVDDGVFRQNRLAAGPARGSTQIPLRSVRTTASSRSEAL